MKVIKLGYVTVSIGVYWRQYVAVILTSYCLLLARL